MTVLRDEPARRTALTARGRSLLVEAGAGSGKTALMAGRVALLLADGEPPDAIAAISFTEAAAAELAARIHRFVHELIDGKVDVALRPALPYGPTAEQVARLEAAADRLDDLTCTTIHGFARDLVRPYPVEASVDPGARVLDGVEQALLFGDTFDAWLRTRLQDGRPAGDVIVTLVTLAPEPASIVDWLRTLADKMRDRPNLHATENVDIGEAVARYEACVVALQASVTRGSITLPEASDLVAEHRALLAAWQRHLTPPTALAVAVAVTRPDTIFTKAGTVRIPRWKGKWASAARAAGRSKAEGEEAHDLCTTALIDVSTALDAVHCAAADYLLARAVEAVREVETLYRARKRSTALLDFDDLLGMAARLLGDHPPVREALAARYRHLLVDEFQDTDPLQAEIVWRLTGAPMRPGDDWRTWPARPGARFVVGDPKQSIYGFRRADVATYLQLREHMKADPGADLIEIKTNFRSVPNVLEHTNRTFAALLAAADQPGYSALDPFRSPTAFPAVVTLPLDAPAGLSKVGADAARETEADVVAAFCEALLHDESYLGRQILAGDIALLAPTGTGLWMYERALEARGIAVASQAGKGYFRRQEVHDLVALTRALADPRDRLAFGALLRGPLVGATDEELLDAAEALAADADTASHLCVLTDPENLGEGPIRRVLERIGPLARRAHRTTPYETLAAAFGRLEVRALLLDRHRGQADRALANVGLFLERSRAYAVRGIRAFAHDVWTEWNDDKGTVEGHADAENAAVTLVTIHSAKGLEWPVVIPVNMLGDPRPETPPFVDRVSGRIVDRVLGCAASGFEEAKASATRASDAERVRLWYVAATRACDLLVLPQPSFAIGARAWLDIVARSWPTAPPARPTPPPAGARAAPRPDTAQSAEVFRAEAAAIAAATPLIRWDRPSRHEGAIPNTDASGILGDPDGSPAAAIEESAKAAPSVKGAGAIRGLIMHKLLEELITERRVADPVLLATRAAELLVELDVPGSPVDPVEVAATALRAWHLPEITPLHERLVAELDVAGHVVEGETTVLWAGVADAVALTSGGEPELVIDWKSDVAPGEAAVSQYRAQVRAYLELLGASEGLLVFATEGRAERVGRT